MNLIEKYSEELKPFEEYRRLWALPNGERGEEPFGSNARVLRFWESHKSEYLYTLLGNQLDISKEVVYNRPQELLTREMYKMCQDQRDFAMLFTNTLWKKLFNTECESNSTIPYEIRCDEEGNAKPAWNFYRTLCSLIGDYETLVNGTCNTLWYTSASEATVNIDGHRLTVSVGQKAMRILGKTAKAIGLEQEFEQYRRAHAQVLNQKKLKGKLHLSIHPLDYATASDNESGWESCMSWQKPGEYRLGTVEMMNSPMVICAYLASDTAEMEIGNSYKWNSKKWRAWVIVTPQVILVNRNYPYDNETLSEICVDWVKDLALEHLGWRYGRTYAELPYADESEDEDHYQLCFETNYMYNDVGDSHAGAFGTDCDKKDSLFYVEFSGEANCMWCGAQIDYNGNDDEAGRLVCNDCNHTLRCSECGCYLDPRENDIYYDEDGNVYCADCYYEQFTHCDFCDDTYRSEDVWTISLPVDQDAKARKLIELANTGDEKAKETIRRYFWDKKNDPVSIEELRGRLGSDYCWNICINCLSDIGVDRSDILYPRRIHRTIYSRWNEQGEITNYYTEGSGLLDPETVSEEAAREIFSQESDSEEVFHVIWESYKEMMKKS